MPGASAAQGLGHVLARKMGFVNEQQDEEEEEQLRGQGSRTSGPNSSSGRKTQNVMTTVRMRQLGCCRCMSASWTACIGGLSVSAWASRHTEVATRLPDLAKAYCSG